MTIVEKVNRVFRYYGSDIDLFKNRLELSFSNVELDKFRGSNYIEYDIYYHVPAEQNNNKYLFTIKFVDGVCKECIIGKIMGDFIHNLYKAIIREENINCILNDD